jgi:hypothetical protein
MTAGDLSFRQLARPILGEPGYVHDKRYIHAARQHHSPRRLNGCMNLLRLSAQK